MQRITQGRIGDKRKASDISRAMELFHLDAHACRRDQPLSECANFPGLQIALVQPPDTDCEFDVAGHQIECLIAQGRIYLAIGIALG